MTYSWRKVVWLLRAAKLTTPSVTRLLFLLRDIVGLLSCFPRGVERAPSAQNTKRVAVLRIANSGGGSGE